MAISREKKQAIVSQLVDVLSNSKLTTFASYEGLTVAEAQELRKLAKEDVTIVRVVKNRLVKVALSQIDQLKQSDTSTLRGQLLYAANAEDEVASAKTLAVFAKDHPAIKLLGAIDADGNVLDETTVNELASLPSKDELRSKLVGTLSAPLGSLTRMLGGNISGLVNVLKAKG